MRFAFWTWFWLALDPILNTSLFMNYVRLLVLLVSAGCIGGCSNIRGAKLLFPESFGLVEVQQNVYIEIGAGEKAKAEIREAVIKAESAIHSTYDGVEAHPVVHACITEECYASFGGIGSRAKIYGNYILLSPRGLNWHFLAHEWSHDEMRARLTLAAWWRLPQWFDEGLAVAVSEAPEHSEDQWRFLVASGAQRPTRTELFSYRSLRQWLEAVQHFGEAQNAERNARGEPEVRPVYAAAGHEVRPWLAEVGSQGLLELINKLNDGEEFETVYSADSNSGSSDRIPCRPYRGSSVSGG